MCFSLLPFNDNIITMHIGGVMVSLLTSSVGSSTGLLKPDYSIGTCSFAAKHTALMSKSKDWWARNEDTCNVMSGATCLSADCCFSEVAL